jgi:hypothetical protein
MVDSSCSLAACGDEFCVCISYASWIARRVAQLYLGRVWLNFSFYQEYYRQTPPKVPHFLKTLVRRKLVLWFLASEILRDYWLSGVCAFVLFLPDDLLMFIVSHMAGTGLSFGVYPSHNGKF